MDLNTKIHFMS